MIPSSHQILIGCWLGGGFETVLAADMTYASRSVEGHAGSYGKWSMIGGGAEDAYLMLDIAAIYPAYVYGMKYTGQGTMGAAKVEFAHKMAMKLCSAGPDSFSVSHEATPAEVRFDRTERLPQPLLAVRVEDMKAQLDIMEASEANNRATWNTQFGIASDLQIDRWKQINSWKLS